jgi:hypothetical protein
LETWNKNNLWTYEDGCKILHHQKDAWNPIMGSTIYQLVIWISLDHPQYHRTTILETLFCTFLAVAIVVKWCFSWITMIYHGFVCRHGGCGKHFARITCVSYFSDISEPGSFMVGHQSFFRSDLIHSQKWLRWILMANHRQSSLYVKREDFLQVFFHFKVHIQSLDGFKGKF